MSLQIGDRGSTKQNSYPPVVVKITQPSGQADILGNKLTLPTELNTNNSAYKLCTQAQAAADTCPSDTQFGGVVAKSPFLSQSLSGPVYLVEQAGRSLPGLLLDLHGRAHVKIQTKTSLINNRQIQSLVLDAPQLPISELTIALDGGRTTGVFQNRSDLCFRGSSTSKVNSVDGLAKFYGWNGANTNDTKVVSTVSGCGPTVSDKLSGATGSRPSLTVNVDAHPGAPNVKELTVSLSKNLSLVRSGFRSGVSGTASATLGRSSFSYVSSRSFKVTDLPSGGVKELTLRLRRGAIKVSERSRSLLRRGRSRKFKVKVTQTPVSGGSTTTRSSVTVKGR
jgi:hypothetical protein